MQRSLKGFPACTYDGLCRRCWWTCLQLCWFADCIGSSWFEAHIHVPSCPRLMLPLYFLLFALIWTTDDSDCSHQLDEQAGSLVQDQGSKVRTLLRKLFIFASMYRPAMPICNRYWQFFEYFLPFIVWASAQQRPCLPRLWQQIWTWALPHGRMLSPHGGFYTLAWL